MDLARSRLAEHADDLARGRPAHDRIVHEHDALALHDLAHRVQLHLDAEVADGLLGLDEGPADVVVADEAEGERDASTPRRSRGPGTCPSPARRRRRPPAPDAPAPGAGRTPAARRRRCGRRPSSRAGRSRRARRRRVSRRESEAVRGEAFPRQLDDLAGLDVALELRPDQVERAGLGGHDRRAFPDAQRQGPDPVRVARGEDALAGEDDDRVRAADLEQRLGDGAGRASATGSGPRGGG